MIRLPAKFAKWLGFVSHDDDGAVLTEALVVIPIITLFTVAVLEFGNMFWQKAQIEVGLRDAARYLARCQQTESFAAACSEDLARNIAFFGSPTGGSLRVLGWSPAGGASISFAQTGEVIRAEATHSFRTSPLFAWLNLDQITINAYHEQRYIGW